MRILLDTFTPLTGTCRMIHRRAAAILIGLFAVTTFADPAKPLVTLSTTSFAAFSPDHRVLLTISATDKQCHFWSLETGEEVNRFGANVERAIFSTDGGRVLVASRDHLIRLFDARTGKALRRLGATFEGTPIMAISSTEIGRLITSAPAGAAGFDPLYWDFATGKPLSIFKGHTAPVTALALSPDGCSTASAQAVAPPPGPKTVDTPKIEDRDVIIKSNPPVRLPRPPSAGPLSGSIPAASPATPGIIRISTTGPGEPVLREIQSPSVPIHLGFSPDSKILYAASATTFGAWSLATGKPLDLSANTDPITPAGRLSPNRRIGLRPAIGSAMLIDPQSSEDLRALAGPIEGLVVCHAFSADVSRIFVGVGRAIAFAKQPSESGSVYLFDVTTGKQLARFDGLPHQPIEVVISPQNTHAFSRDADNTVMLWKLP